MYFVNELGKCKHDFHTGGRSKGKPEQEQYKPLTGTTYETDNKGNSLAGI